MSFRRGHPCRYATGIFWGCHPCRCAQLLHLLCPVQCLRKGCCCWCLADRLGRAAAVALQAPDARDDSGQCRVERLWQGWQVDQCHNRCWLTLVTVRGRMMCLSMQFLVVLAARIVWVSGAAGEILFQSMRAEGLKSNLISCNSLMTIFEKNGEWRHAQKHAGHRAQLLWCN